MSAVLPPNDVYAFPLSIPGSIRVTWLPPNTTHGLDVIGLSVQYSETNGADGRYRTQSFDTVAMVGDTMSVDFSGLELAQTYTIQVAVVTTAGIGTYSEPANVTTYQGKTIKHHIHLHTYVYL